MIPHVTAPTFRPPHQTAYESRVVTFRAPCPVCFDDCRWTATAAHGAVPHCPCSEEEAA